MGLIQRFNLIFISVFIIGLLSTGYLSYVTEFKQAREMVVQRAEMMVKTAFAAREYTSEEIEPFLVEKNRDSKDIFYPQAIPAYTANRIFALLAKKYPLYTYHEVALNPRNPQDLASAWEVEIIRNYQINPDLNRLVNIRTINKQDFLYVSYPIQITDPKCLRCHTDAKTAPSALVKKYGPTNGMNWKLGEVIGAHMVSIPMSLPKKKARESVFTTLISLISIFTVMFLIINFILVRWVVSPLSEIARITGNISLAKEGKEEFPAIAVGEIGLLISAIKRLKISLEKALKKIAGKESKNQN